MESVLYVINPAGHGGAGKAAWKKFESLWPETIDPKDVIVTVRPGHAREIATSRTDCSTVVAVGGDGTANEVMSGMLDREDSQTRLAIVPAGTGNDIARHAGINSIEDAVVALREGRDRAYDLIQVDYDVGDVSQRGHAFLQATVGFSAVPGVQPWMKRLLGPKMAYYLGTLVQVVRYRPPRMTVHWGEHEYSGLIWMVIVGNTEFTSGGSMCLSPGARTDDGELNITVIPVKKSKLKMTTELMPKIATGDHVLDPDVEYFPAKGIEVQCDRTSIVDLDGDVVEATRARFRVCPGALRILTPKPSD